MTVEATGAQGGAEAIPGSQGTVPGAADAPEGTAAPDAATGQSAETTLPPEIVKLRNETAALRRQLQALQKQAKQEAQETLTEAERIAAEKAAIEAEKAALERERRVFGLRQAALAAASRAGAIYPDVIDALLVSRMDQIDFDDSGRPQNVDALVAELRKTHPGLFRAPAGTADGGAGTSSRPAAGGMNEFIRRAAGRGG
jgi:hypothetical protein